MERADFYVLEGSDARARWRFACQEIEKAFLAEERVLVWLDNDADLAAFDDLLWTFADRSFIPHEALGPESSWDETPVLLSAKATPEPAPQNQEKGCYQADWQAETNPVLNKRSGPDGLDKYETQTPAKEHGCP